MTQSTSDQLAALAKELVNAAAEQRLTMRVLGGVAVYLTCPSIATHPTLPRAIKDLDFVAPRADFDALAELFFARGVTAKTRDESQWLFDKDGVEIELTDPIFHERYHLDFTARLALASPTLPLADLLLIKLQRAPFADKDIKDAIALLLDHHAARGEADGQIDCAYIAQLCARDWGLFTAVYDNTVRLEQILDRYLVPKEAQLVWQRIEVLQAEMDRAPKSFAWMVNQILRRPAQVPA